MHIPCDLLVFKVAPHLEPKDRLALATACKETYSAFFDANPTFRGCYSQKHRCGIVLQKMLDFVYRGPTSVASWTLLSGSRELLVCRLQRACYCVPGECVEDMFEWFSNNMWGHRIEISTRCYYKKKDRRDEFSCLTQQLIEAISGKGRLRR